MFKSNLLQKSKKIIFFQKSIFFLILKKLKHLSFFNLIFFKIEKIKKKKNEKKSLFQKILLKMFKSNLFQKSKQNPFFFKNQFFFNLKN